MFLQRKNDFALLLIWPNVKLYILRNPINLSFLKIQKFVLTVNLFAMIFNMLAEKACDYYITIRSRTRTNDPVRSTTGESILWITNTRKPTHPFFDEIISQIHSKFKIYFFDKLFFHNAKVKKYSELRVWCCTKRVWINAPRKIYASCPKINGGACDFRVELNSPLASLQTFHLSRYLCVTLSSMLHRNFQLTFTHSKHEQLI